MAPKSLQSSSEETTGIPRSNNLKELQMAERYNVCRYFSTNVKARSKRQCWQCQNCRFNVQQKLQIINSC